MILNGYFLNSSVYKNKMLAYYNSKLEELTHGSTIMKYISGVYGENSEDIYSMKQSLFLSKIAQFSSTGEVKLDQETVEKRETKKPIISNLEVEKNYINKKEQTVIDKLVEKHGEEKVA